MGRKFRKNYVNAIRRRTPRLGDKWPLVEVVIIKGKRHILWRAVDQDGFVLEVLLPNTVIPRLPSVSFGNCYQSKALFPVLYD